MSKKKAAKPKRKKKAPKLGYIVGDDGCFELPPKKRKPRK